MSKNYEERYKAESYARQLEEEAIQIEQQAKLAVERLRKRAAEIRKRASYSAKISFTPVKIPKLLKKKIKINRDDKKQSTIYDFKDLKKTEKREIKNTKLSKHAKYYNPQDSPLPTIEEVKKLTEIKPEKYKLKTDENIGKNALTYEEMERKYISNKVKQMSHFKEIEKFLNIPDSVKTIAGKLDYAYRQGLGPRFEEFSYSGNFKTQEAQIRSWNKALYWSSAEGVDRNIERFLKLNTTNYLVKQDTQDLLRNMSLDEKRRFLQLTTFNKGWFWHNSKMPMALGATEMDDSIYDLIVQVKNELRSG